MTIAFAAAVAARISREAQRVRYCCRPLRLITAGTRYAVAQMGKMERQNRRVSWNLLFRVSGSVQPQDVMTYRMLAKFEIRMMDTGKTIRIRSVIMLKDPMVMS
jgi:hypothetical protein